MLKKYLNIQLLNYYKPTIQFKITKTEYTAFWTFYFFLNYFSLILPLVYDKHSNNFEDYLLPRFQKRTSRKSNWITKLAVHVANR